MSAGFIPQLSIAQYVGFALWFLMVFGLIFEVPLAITLMAKLGWVDAPFLKRYRKWALLGAVYHRRHSDPHAGSRSIRCLMALPMYIFYEVGIISAGFFNKETGGRTGHCRGAGRAESHGAGHVGCRATGSMSVSPPEPAGGDSGTVLQIQR